MITLDTSGIFALLNRTDPDHRPAIQALREDPGPYLVPAAILAEIGFLVGRRLGLDVLVAFLEDLRTGGFALDCGDENLARVAELLRRYRTLGVDLADAAVIACAEHHGGRTLTLDRRHFSVVGREGRITLLPS